MNLSKSGEFLFGRNAERRLLPSDDISDASRFDYFWVGCSDCPMSPNEAVGVPASDFIFHDNVANLVSPADVNCLAALQFAVDVSQVKNVVVCGHYECRGVKFAIENTRLDILGNWLAPILKTRREYENLLDGIGDESMLLNALCELNVIEQLHNACQTTIVRHARERGQILSVRGAIYDARTDSLAELGVCAENQNDYRGVYAEAIADFKRRWQL